MPGAGEMGAKSYRARLLRSAGVSSTRAFQSDFGKKALMKYGWKEGEGLGRLRNGRTDCVQAERRDLKSGLGAEKRSADAQWDNWWADCFNTVAQKITVSASKTQVETDSSSEDEAAPEGGRITAVKKAGAMPGKLRRVLRQETAAVAA